MSEKTEPASTAPQAEGRVFTPTVLAWLGALTAAVAPAVQFVNGYWANQLKQTEIAHQVAMDFAKLAIADNASREYRRDTLKVIASIQGNPLQAWANAELKSRQDEQDAIKEALRSRLAGRHYTTLDQCKAYLEQQLKVQSYLVAETFDRKDMKDTLVATAKDEFTTSVERDCRNFESGSPPPVVVAAATKPSNGTGTSPTDEKLSSSDSEGPLGTLTVAKLARIYPHARPADLQTYLPLLRKGLARAKIDTPMRVAMFLAQIGQESAELRFTQELSSGEAYEGRQDLGNTQAGDGALFKGRGLIQVAGRANYQAFTTAIGRPDVMASPSLVASDPELALEAALWFWTTKNLNLYSDADDIRTLTRRLTGSYNGLEQRIAYLAAAKAAL